MKKKKLKVETFNIKKWNDLVTGLILSENKDWILVHNIPSDYRLDGYTIYRKKFVKKRIRKADEKFVEKVLGLRKKETAAPPNFKFGTDVDMLKWVEKTYGLFEFQDHDDSILFYGKINNIKKDKLIIDMVKSDGTIEKKFETPFSLKKIRSITFDSDYFKAVVLLMKNQAGGK